MDEETVIQTLFEIANEGDYADDAIDLLRNELNDHFPPNDIDKVIQLAKYGNRMINKLEYAEDMYLELLRDSNHISSLNEEIKGFRMRCLLLCKHHTHKL